MSGFTLHTVMNIMKIIKELELMHTTDHISD